jgi:hypothetical protein
VDAAGRVMINDGGRLCKAHFGRPRNVNYIIHSLRGLGVEKQLVLCVNTYTQSLDVKATIT